jgi:hypothetical protein
MEDLHSLDLYSVLRDVLRRLGIAGRMILKWTSKK